MKQQWIIAVFTIALFLPQTACAGYISMSLQTEVPDVLIEGVQTMSVTMGNHGDDTAYDVTVDLLTPQGFETQPKNLGVLAPMATKFATFSLDVADISSGSYVGFIKISYKDANGHPFSILSPLYLNKDAVVTPNTQSESEPVVIVPDGSTVFAKVSLTNNEPHSITPTLRLYSPDEVDVAAPAQPTQLPAGQSSQVTFPVSTKTATPGSTYVVYGVYEYLTPNGITSHISSTKVIVQVAPEKTSYHSMVFPLALVGLVFIFVMVQAYHLIGWLNERKDETEDKKEAL